MCLKFGEKAIIRLIQWGLAMVREDWIPLFSGLETASMYFESEYQPEGPSEIGISW
jgi:hypothetical protein